jgi:Ca2+-binding EF-hand superfamily protein
VNCVRVVQSWEEQRAEIQAEDRRRREQSDILGKVFALVDTDGSGLIDQEEMSQALQSNPQVRDEFAASTNSLRPMLEQAFFMKAFRLMDTDDEDGVSLEEFVRGVLPHRWRGGGRA